MRWSDSSTSTCVACCIHLLQTFRADIRFRLLQSGGGMSVAYDSQALKAYLLNSREEVLQALHQRGRGLQPPPWTRDLAGEQHTLHFRSESMMRVSANRSPRTL